MKKPHLHWAYHPREKSKKLLIRAASQKNDHMTGQFSIKIKDKIFWEIGGWVFWPVFLMGMTHSAHVEAVKVDLKTDFNWNLLPFSSLYLVYLWQMMIHEKNLL